MTNLKHTEQELIETMDNSKEPAAINTANAK